MVSQKVKITNPTGLHLRPAGIFSNIANKFECRITFEYENSIANAKSVLSILGAGIKSGDEILLICEGEEEEKALKAMIEAIESGLGEYTTSYYQIKNNKNLLDISQRFDVMSVLKNPRSYSRRLPLTA